MTDGVVPTGALVVPISTPTRTLDYAGSIYAQIEAQGFTNVVTPVPEPETYAMLLAGLGLIGAAVRRRNKR